MAGSWSAAASPDAAADATHSGGTGIFSVGQPASLGVKEIAENGNLAPLIAALEADPRVSHPVAAGAPLVPPGPPLFGTFDDEVTLTIEADPEARFLSYVSMLICTNDGFTGIDRLRLPNQVGDALSVATASYDAGTGVSTEDFADIVPPCQPLMGVSSGEPGTGMSDPALAEGASSTTTPASRAEPIFCRRSMADPRHGWPAGSRRRSPSHASLATCGRHP